MRVLVGSFITNYGYLRGKLQNFRRVEISNSRSGKPEVHTTWASGNMVWRVWVAFRKNYPLFSARMKRYQACVYVIMLKSWIHPWTVFPTTFKPVFPGVPAYNYRNLMFDQLLLWRTYYPSYSIRFIHTIYDHTKVFWVIFHSWLLLECNFTSANGVFSSGLKL